MQLKWSKGYPQQKAEFHQAAKQLLRSYIITGRKWATLLGKIMETCCLCRPPMAGRPALVTITAHCTEYYDLRLMKLLMKYTRNIDAASNFLIAIIFGG